MNYYDADTELRAALQTYNDLLKKLDIERYRVLYPAQKLYRKLRKQAWSRFKDATAPARLIYDREIVAIESDLAKVEIDYVAAESEVQRRYVKLREYGKAPK